MQIKAESGTSKDSKKADAFMLYVLLSDAAGQTNVLRSNCSFSPILLVLMMVFSCTVAVEATDSVTKTKASNLTRREQGAVESGFPIVVPTGLPASEYYRLAEGYAGLEMLRQAEEALTMLLQSKGASNFDEKVRVLRATKLPRRNISEAEQHDYLAAASIDYVKDISQSRAALEACLRKYPDFDLPYAALGYREAWAENRQRAIDLDKKCLEINPRNVSALNNMGEEYLWLNQVDLAMVAFRKALTIDPSDGIAASRLSAEKAYRNKSSFPNKALEAVGGALIGPALLIRECLPQTDYGFIDKSGKMVLSAGYDAGYFGSQFADGLIPVNYGSKYWNTQGRQAFTRTFAEGQDFSEGLAGVKVGKLWGYIDKSGNVQIKPQFDHAESFHYGLAAVQVKGKWGFVDRSGKLAIPAIYDGCFNFSDGLAAVLKDQKIGYIDTKGGVIIPRRFDFVNSFSEGFAVVGITEGPTLAQHEICINKVGKTVFDLRKLKQQYGESVAHGSTPCRNAMKSTSFRSGFDCCQFHEGVLMISLGKKQGYISTSGEVLITAKFDRACDFHDGLAAVSLGDLWGYIDHRGAPVISPKYKSVRDFSEGLAAVQVNERFGFIDKTGNLVIKPTFEAVESFSQGLAQVGSAREYL